MMKTKIPQKWVEIHCRTCGAPPISFASLSSADYTLCGEPIPFSELKCVSDVYTMFRKVPEGCENWLLKPLGLYDVLTVCSPLRNGRVIPHPFIIIPEKEANDFDLVAHKFGNELRQIFRPMDYSTLPPQIIPGIVLAAIQTDWDSKCYIR